MAGRRGHGEGSAFRRDADGKWLAVLELGRDQRTGRRVRRTVTAPTRREAVERLRQLRRDVERGAVDADPRTTVAEWTQRWLEHIEYRRDVIGDLRPNTAGSYERLARIHVVGQLGALRLTNLTPGHIERACQSLLDDGLAPSSVARVVQVIRMMLDHAVREGALVANPIDRAQVPRQTRQPVAAFATEDVERILDAAADTTDAALWAMLALARLRLGEALGLADEDVDLDAGTVRVRRTLLRSFGPPKSARGEREVPMPDELVRVLRRPSSPRGRAPPCSVRVGRDRRAVPHAARHLPAHPQRPATLQTTGRPARSARGHVTAHVAPHVGLDTAHVGRPDLPREPLRRPRHHPDDRRPVRPSAARRRRVRPAHPRHARRALPRKRLTPDGSVSCLSVAATRPDVRSPLRT